ncbi:MAG TPA: FkbM family methyltransferase [Longimicrobium sp.]|nr:FkbM family methyltransferase [Longimicrobium sp.]
MDEERARVSESEAYRRVSALERAGTLLGRMVPGGAVRRVLRRAYHTVISLRGGGRGVVAALPGGERVRLLPQYRFVTWNPAEYAAFRAASARGGVALDVGANVGAYTLLFARWVHPGGRVYAFEPAPEAFDGLVRHLLLNELREVVTPVCAAVSSSSGSAALVADGVAGTNRLAPSSSGSASGDRTARVETVSLDDFCAREGVAPTVIKVDVEGAELEVLRGARQTLRRVGAGLAVFVEMHPTLWKEMGIGREDVIAELASQGLRAEPLRPCDDPWALEGECLRLARID